MIDYNSLDVSGRVKYICQNFMLVISFVGIVGNAITMCVLSRPRLRKYSYAFYAKLLAASDILILAHSFRHWAHNVAGADMDILNEFLCRVGEYQPNTGVVASLWLLTLISLDRLVTIVYPKKLAFLKLPWVKCGLVLAVFVYSLLINLPLPLTYRLKLFNSTEPNGGVDLVCYQSVDETKMHLWLIVANMFVVNILVNNALNIRMIEYVFSSRNQLGCLKKCASRNRKFAMSSIGLSLCCLFFKLPLTVGMLVINYLRVSYEQYQLIFTICVTLSTIDNADAFFVNMSVNSTFAREFKRMYNLDSRGRNKKTINYRC